MNKYKFKAGGTCPINGRRDLFDVTIKSDRLVLVEDLLEVVDELNNQPIFQEGWTRALAERLGVEVVTKGWHSGVRVVCREH